MSNTQEMVGIVEEVLNLGKAKGSGLRIGGRKYGVYDPTASGLDKVAAGTTVSFRFTEKPSGGEYPYKNINGRITTVTDGTALTPAPVSSEPSSAPVSTNRYRKNGEEGGFPIHAKAYERALDRRNALTNAVNLVSSNKDYESDMDSVLRIAKEFEAYTTGDLDQDAEDLLLMNDDTFDID